MPKGNLPTYRGQVCDENKNVLGAAVLWLQSEEERKSEKSPVLRGTIEFSKEGTPYLPPNFAGLKMRIAFWPNKPKEESK